MGKDNGPAGTRRRAGPKTATRRESHILKYTTERPRGANEAYLFIPYVLRFTFYSQFYCVNYVLVAGAAAERARNGLADFLFGGVGVAFQKGHQ